MLKARVWTWRRSAGHVMAMTAVDIALLICAGFIGGTVNAIAGGGTFFTFSALLAVGLPPIQANATSAMVLTPANITSVTAYLPEIRRHARRYLPLAFVSVLGGLAGALLLIVTPSAAFRAIVPYCLGFATLLFATAPYLSRWMSRLAHAPGSPLRRRIGTIAQFLVSVYGGYFGAGMGIMMLSSLALTEGDDYHFINAAKNVCALLIQFFALGPLIVAGLVAWPEAMVAAVAAAIGGLIGVALARRVPLRLVRGVVVAMGTLLTLRFALFG
jgi:uncharacterized protein